MDTTFKHETVEKLVDIFREHHKNFSINISNDLNIIHSFFLNTNLITEPKDSFFLISKCSIMYLNLIQLLRDKNYYSAKIIYRSLIEHYLKSQYLLSNFDKNKNLSFDYHLYGKIEEFINDIKMKNLHRSLKGMDKLNEWELVKSSFPEIEFKTKKDLNDEIQNFSIKNIIKKLTYLFKEYSQIHDHFEIITRDYWESSMFVHGNPGANDFLIKSNNQYNEDEILDIYNMITIPFFFIFDTIKFILYHSKARFSLPIQNENKLHLDLESLVPKISKKIEYLKEIE
ncbi:DUF5677 domain-containing protein [Leptospira terpstrae]|nr:DUF5677 domain-containing protein [Leptospira terpstrae]